MFILHSLAIEGGGGEGVLSNGRDKNILDCSFDELNELNTIK